MPGARGELIGTLVRERALLSLPPQVPILGFTLLDGTPGDEGGAARGPRRTRWRAGGQIPPEFRFKGDKLHLHAPGFDWRLGAALIALLRSFNGSAWDDTKQ